MKYRILIISIIISLIFSSCQLIDELISPRIEWDGIKDGICHVEKSGGTFSICGTLNSGHVINVEIPKESDPPVLRMKP
jgi:hypothetical protein